MALGVEPWGASGTSGCHPAVAGALGCGGRWIVARAHDERDLYLSGRTGLDRSGRGRTRLRVSRHCFRGERLGVVVPPIPVPWAWLTTF